MLMIRSTPQSPRRELTDGEWSPNAGTTDEPSGEIEVHMGTFERTSYKLVLTRAEAQELSKLLEAYVTLTSDRSSN